MSPDFAADQNTWGVVPAPLAPKGGGAPPYANVKEAVAQVLAAVQRNLPATFAPPPKKAKKGLAFVLPWGTVSLVLEKTKVRLESWQKTGVTAKVPKLFDHRVNERSCRPSTRLGTLELAAAACFAAAGDRAAARACLDVFRAGEWNQDLRGAGANSYIFELSGNQRADTFDAIDAIVSESPPPSWSN